MKQSNFLILFLSVTILFFNACMPKSAEPIPIENIANLDSLIKVQYKELSRTISLHKSKSGKSDDLIDFSEAHNYSVAYRNKYGYCDGSNTGKVENYNCFELTSEQILDMISVLDINNTKQPNTRFYFGYNENKNQFQLMMVGLEKGVNFQTEVPLAACQNKIKIITSLPCPDLCDGLKSDQQNVGNVNAKILYGENYKNPTNPTDECR